MTAKLESLIKRELKLGHETYTVSMSPEGVKIALKGRTQGARDQLGDAAERRCGARAAAQDVRGRVRRNGRRVSAARDAGGRAARRVARAPARHAGAASRAPRAHASHRGARREDAGIGAARVLRARPRASRGLRGDSGAGLLSGDARAVRESGVPHARCNSGRRSTSWMSSAARRTSRRTWTTFWRSDRRRCGFSRGSGTMRWRSSSRARVSRWCRIDVCWWSSGASGGRSAHALHNDFGGPTLSTSTSPRFGFSVHREFLK